MNVKYDVLSVNEFIDNVSDEYNYLKKGTDYRRTTATLALQIALGASKVEPFLDQKTSEMIVKERMPKQYLDNDRIRDVAKMLRMNAAEVIFKQIETQEMRDYVKSKLEQVQLI